MALNIKKSKPFGEDPDGDLLPAMMSGDQQAFSLLVDRHIGKLSALAAQMLGDVHLAEDIVQTVFLKTWHLLPNWETGNAKLITWMRRVTTNACLDHLRKRKPVYTDKVPETPSLENNPEQSFGIHQENAVLRGQIDVMPERQKAALTLFYYQDLSLKESAEIMDIAPAAFESLLRRARKTLKQQLEPIERLS